MHASHASAFTMYTSYFRLQHAQTLLHYCYLKPYTAYGVHIARTTNKKSNPPNCSHGDHQDRPTINIPNPKLQLTETCSTDIYDVNSLCTDFLHPSASNDTSLSGNDYVEVTSGKEKPISKRPRSNSNSPRRSASE